MKKIWDIVYGFKIPRTSKIRVFFLILVLVNAVIGAIIWLLIGRLFLPGIDWLICFIYPVIFIGLLGGTLFLVNHDF